MRIVIVALALLAALTGLAAPFYQKLFVDRLLGAESIHAHLLNWEWINTISPLTSISLAFVCALLSQAVSLVAYYAGTREGLILQRKVSEDLYKKMLSIRPDSMGSTTVGEVVSIYATDVPGSTAVVDQTIPMAAGIVFPLVFAPLAVQWISGFPLWATISVMAVIVALNVVLGTRQSRFFLRYKQLAAERTGLVNEWVQNIRLLRILGWVENFESKIFSKRVQETRNRVAMVTNGQLMGSFGSSISFVINLTGVASLVFLGGRAVTPGELFALLWIFGVFLARPFRQIPWIFTFTLDSISSVVRLEAFLRRKSDAGEVSERPLDVDLSKALDLEVKGLNLTIGGKHVLKDVAFKLSPGEFVAIVGEVGSGKSLLALSLVGETGADFETFRAGPVDAKSLDLNSRRKLFAFVPQEGFVMSASLRENIAFEYGVDPSEDEGVEFSLRTAQFRIDGENLRDGLETEIGERGVNLSGGQRQRVSLARAHHFDRPIVLLDDCLSAVDVDTENQLLFELIDGEWREKTRILVTHRLTVLDRVDRVFFIEDGCIVETGTFDELMGRSRRMQEFVASVRRSEAQAAEVVEIDGAKAGKERANDGDTEHVS